MNIAVVALGKIGLPLAVQFASRGHSVIGCDVNAECVEQVNRGFAPFPGEAGLDERLADVVGAGLLSATVDTTSAVAQSDAVVIVVPLFVDGAGIPDFGWMDAATVAVGRGLRAGTLVSYETTLPVGTTRNRFAPKLEKESGLVAGSDFALAFSPERVLTGRVFSDLRRYPKLVGGYSTACATRAVEFYSQVLDFDDRPELPRANGVWDLGSCETSEMAKLAETTYRDVNIGLANQFARFAAENNIDMYSVIEACNTQPYSHIHQPGIAVGGHCIPIYPQMYLWNDPSATIVRAAREANWAMPGNGVDLLERTHGSLRGQQVGVFGVSYRGGVKESAFSGVFPLVEELTKRGASVLVHDPMYSHDEIADLGFNVFSGKASLDAVIIQADHPEYASFSTFDFGNPRTLLNGRNMLLTASVPVILTLGRPATTSA